MSKDDWSKYKKVLCLRQDNLGDVLMVSPAIKAFKAQNPNRKITLLTSKRGSEVAKYISDIDRVIVFDVPWMKSDDSSGKAWKTIQEIKKNRFEAAIIFTNYSQNPLPGAMLCFLAGIPNVLGYCRENPYKLLTHWVPDQEPLGRVVHGVERQLELVERVGALVSDDNLRLRIPWNLKGRVLKKLIKAGVNIDQNWIIMHPGASEVKRQYPLKLFAESARQITQRLDYQIVLTGDVSEKKIAAELKKETGNQSFSVAGQLSIGELIVLIKMAKLLIANNTGPVHLAAALQTPVVDLYARTNPEHVPWKVKSKVLYFDVPKDLQSKNEILKFTAPKDSVPLPLPEDIVDAVSELLNEKDFIF